MTQIGDGNDEDDSRNGCHGYDCIKRPDEATAGICNAEQTDADTAFDGDCARCVEELGDEK